MDKRKRNIRPSILIAALLSATFLLAQAGSLDPPGSPSPTMVTLDDLNNKLDSIVGGSDPRTPILGSSIPVTINSSGSYYLTGDATVVTGPGITIDAADVTLDLNGFTLVGGSGDGILVTANGSRAKIKNGTVRDWGNRGIRADAANNAVVENVMAYNNGSHGIQVRNGGTIRNCTADNNGFTTTSDGLAAEDRSLVIGSVARNNARYGIHVTNEGFIVLSNAAGNGTGNYLASGGSDVAVSRP